MNKNKNCTNCGASKTEEIEEGNFNVVRCSYCKTVLQRTQSNKTKVTIIDTGGSALVNGSVTCKTFIGRDSNTKIVKSIHDEETGDKVSGDKIIVANISNSNGIAIGKGAKQTVITVR